MQRMNKKNKKEIEPMNTINIHHWEISGTDRHATQEENYLIEKLI